MRLQASEQLTRWLAFALVTLLSVVPILAVRYPPVVDLAQQVAQIPVLESALGEGADRYTIEWSSPNKLSYILLAAGWLLGGPEGGARIGLIAILVATLGGIHLLGARMHRPLSHVVLASVLVWGGALYWGFLNFLLGVVALAIYLPSLVAKNDAENESRVFFQSVMAGFIFYLCHVTWIAAAVGLTLVVSVVQRSRPRILLIRLAGLAPFLLAAALWNFRTSEWKVEDRVLWDVSPLERLVSPSYWQLSFLGGLSGPWEYIVLAILVSVAVAALLLRPEGSAFHRGLAAASATFLLAALLLPNRLDEGIFFASRWGMFAGVCGILALPSFPRSQVATALAFALLLAQIAVTTKAWVNFDRNEMAGFDQCRQAVPTGARLLSLDFSMRSPGFLDRRTLQMAAYVRLDREVDLNFSFAEHRSSLVVERELPRRIPWTRKLEWRPDRLREQDLDYFDVLLVRGTAQIQKDLVTSLRRLKPIAGSGTWALYRIEPR